MLKKRQENDKECAVQSFRRGVAIAEAWFFHLWYLIEYKWEKYDFQTVCSLDLDEGLCKNEIGKNDAIAMLWAVKKTFFSQTQSKKNLYDFKEDINMKPCTWCQDPELAWNEVMAN